MSNREQNLNIIVSTLVTSSSFESTIENAVNIVLPNIVSIFELEETKPSEDDITAIKTQLEGIYQEIFIDFEILNISRTSLKAILASKCSDDELANIAIFAQKPEMKVLLESCTESSVQSLAHVQNLMNNPNVKERLGNMIEERMLSKIL